MEKENKETPVVGRTIPKWAKLTLGFVAGAAGLRVAYVMGRSSGVKKTLEQHGELPAPVK